MHISCLASSAQCSICDSHQYYIQFWFIFFFLLFLNIELWSTLVLVHFSLLQNCRTRLRCIYLLHCSWIVGRVPSRQCCCDPLCACISVQLSGISGALRNAISGAIVNTSEEFSSAVIACYTRTGNNGESLVLWIFTNLQPPFLILKNAYYGYFLTMTKCIKAHTLWGK